VAEAMTAIVLRRPSHDVEWVPTLYQDMEGPLLDLEILNAPDEDA
jgi:hypothetical protein